MMLDFADRRRGGAIERLERRVLLSAVIIDRTLLVEGTSTANVIDINTDGTSTTVKFRRSIIGTFANSDFDRINVQALDGNDSVTIGVAVLKPATLDGGDGDDYLLGGGGDDVIRPGLGNDTLQGGGDRFELGGGVNTADYSDRTENLTFGGGPLTASGERDVLALGSNLQRLLTGSGDDTIDMSANYPGDTRYIDVGAGNDNVTLRTGAYGGDMIVRGRAGDDRILITGSNAQYFGDEGNDTFTVERSSFTAREFFGGPGIDTVDYSGGGTSFFSINVTLDDQPNDGSLVEFRYQSRPDNVHSDVEKVLGTSQGSRIMGSSGDNTIAGSTTSDVLVSGGGRDRLTGGTANDLLISTGGSSTLQGDAGDDTLIGTKDDVFISDGSDTIIDEPLAFVNGMMVIRANQDAREVTVLGLGDTVLASLNNGAVISAPRAQVTKLVLIGTDGADSIRFQGLAGLPCTVMAGGGNDTIEGGAASVIAGDGDDVIHTSNSTIDGGAGDDDIDASGTISGGDGNDTIHAFGIVDGARGDDRVSGGGLLVGGPGDDTVTGSGGGDSFQPDYATPGYMYIPGYWAALGDDSIDGAGGNDYIYDFDGQNTLNGGVGNDTITAAEPELSFMNGGDGDDSMTGGRLNSVIGGAGNDILEGWYLDGGDGNDVFKRGFGPQTMLGGAGNDLFSDNSNYGSDTGGDFVDAGSGNDTIYGAMSRDTLLAGDGNDVAYGKKGDDYVDGGAGDDSLFGQDGDDTLIGGPGIDVLDGGPGRNVIIDDFPGPGRGDALRLINELL
jgi:Ca2+-binding RTX toxin-like protein